MRDKIKKNINYAVLCRLRRSLNHALEGYTKTGKIKPSKKYGIDYKKIVEHLKPFPKNISNYEIDHIRPLSSFTLANPDGSVNIREVKKAFAPKNHQWLTIFENRSKGGTNRLDYIG